MSNSVEPVVGALELRKIRAGEAALITDIALRSKASWGYPADFMQACRQELTVTEAQLEAEKVEFWGVTRDGEMLGFYAIAVTDPQTVELEALYVDPEVLRCGIGRRLMNHAMWRACAKGASSLIIQGDPPAEAFYRRMGAVAVGARASGSIAGRMLPLFRMSLS